MYLVHVLRQKFCFTFTRCKLEAESFREAQPVLGSAAASEVGPRHFLNAVQGMVESKIQPRVSLQLAAGAAVRVYDRDHFTSSVLSPCSGKAPVNRVLNKHSTYVRRLFESEQV